MKNLNTQEEIEAWFAGGWLNQLPLIKAVGTQENEWSSNDKGNNKKISFLYHDNPEDSDEFIEI